MKLLAVLFIALLFIEALVEAKSLSDTPTNSLSQKDAGGDFGSLLKKHQPKKINCSYACSRRCRKASRKKICHRACKTCCKRCNCVPPGTYGNKELCPCYASLRTHGNKPKCP
ncbi:hypothetical protein CDL12_16500 [Handroanthus impetiginosus]|uniref:Gibberellin regulated protein n=1 Tax=Handroanthus impetiginosus TaxID=429701 RepID=A0A2G9H035_9LAMI|nr:hypothetical protein CDL12_16500 [Handroanthus impetiginosus]